MDNRRSEREAGEMADNKELLEYHENRIKDLIIMKEALSHAIVIVDSGFRKTKSGIEMAIDEITRELNDERCIMEEIKIHIEKENGI